MRSSRIAPLDALRGLAILLMTLDHAANFTRVSVIAEHYSDRTTLLWSWPYWVTGLLTNIAGPTFWMLSGVSIALLAQRSHQRLGSEWPTTQFLLVRVAVLLTLDVTIIPFLWAPLHHPQYIYTFNLLSSLAVGMLLMSVLRFLPVGLLAALMIALFVGYQKLVALAPTGASGWALWLRPWLKWDGVHQPNVTFPVLGWFSLMGLGFVLGRALPASAWSRARTWALAGMGLLVLWFWLRLSGGYGNFVAYRPGQPWRDFLIMSKGPPGMDYMTFNLGLGLLLMAALWAARPHLARTPLRWLVVYGQAPLFVYVAHLVIYKFGSRVAFKLLPYPSGLCYAVTWLVAMAVLLPLAQAYRRLKERNPRSVLRYL